ncbi:MAG: hypothetical protein AB7O74_15820 [Candidatus Nanopelagicales bacterium]
MTFEDLPDNWPTLSLTEPRLLADVLDLVVGYRERVDESFVVLVCDDDVRLVQPCVIGPDPGPCDPAIVRTFFDAMREGMAEVCSGGTVIVASARARGLSPTPDDEAWVAATRAALAGTGWSVSSAHVVTLDGSRPMAA